MRRHAVPTLAELKERVQIVRLTTKDLCAQARRNSEAVGRVKQCMTSAEVKRDAPLREPINANAMTNAPPGTIAFPASTWLRTAFPSIPLPTKRRSHPPW